MFKKIIFIIFFCSPLLADDDVRIGYGIFTNAGYSSNHRGYLGTDLYFRLINVSTIVKPGIDNETDYDFSAGVGLFNIIQFQHGWGSKSKFVKINCDLPLFNYIEGKPRLTYMYAREYFYRRINLNLNYTWYYEKKEKIFSLGLGYLLL
ncbi:MAG TPA: hypothetical protein PLA54_01840 [Spirochaetota bacterium]|nr:hypothetical protein [Spirochaetota bacterium]MBP9022665.1 hypothetical protein [Spirochaetota bacterium]HOU84699.1 hypothetical protein [Spirochaetota bacterium]HQE57914.1 hypothetical protein [Spirochaetota bacterium]